MKQIAVRVIDSTQQERLGVCELFEVRTVPNIDVNNHHHKPTPTRRPRKTIEERITIVMVKVLPDLLVRLLPELLVKVLPDLLLKTLPSVLNQILPDMLTRIIDERVTLLINQLVPKMIKDALEPIIRLNNLKTE